MKIKLADANHAQLLHFVQVRLGQRNVSATIGTEKLIDIIRKNHDKDEIEVEDTAFEKAMAANSAGKKLDPLRYGVNDPKVTITLHSSAGKGGDRNLHVACNGVSFYVPRGRPVDIPLRFFTIIENAVEDVHDGWDDKRNQNADPRQRQSYTYTVHKMPPTEEIEAWKKFMAPHLEKQRKAKMRRIAQSRGSAGVDIEESAAA